MLRGDAELGGCCVGPKLPKLPGPRVVHPELLARPPPAVAGDNITSRKPNMSERTYVSAASSGSYTA